MNVVEEFLDFISAEKGLVANTFEAYKSDLDQFFQHCLVHHADPLDASLSDLRKYLASLRRRDLAPRTMARKLSVLKQFYKFLLRENKIQSDPSELLSVMVKARKLPKTLTIEEMVCLLEAADGSSESEIRDRALLETWYATGCRISEISHLTASSIDWQDGAIKFIGKGGAERIVPIGRTALEWCRKYQAIRHRWIKEHKLAEVDIFFLSRFGKGFSRQGIWKNVKKYAKKAGLTKRVWPHMIRHTFATHVLLGGADLRAVQELLGHKSITATEIYTHLDIENLKIMQLKYHPRG
ncbi:MAG: tyrosine recombinase [Deltaproteobacteria bacterium]|nr:tyrosine recombinase [Deltaproteobacteria bacterium]